MILLVACRPAEDGRPDVLLITVDTLRADHLGAYGFPFDSSPNLDALASRSVLFERGIASSSRTAPSHASIMTSRRVREHSVGHRNGTSTLEGLPTLAEHFRNAGWATGGFIGNILLTRHTGLHRGFEVFDDNLKTPELNRPHVVERRAEETTRLAIDWLALQHDRPVFLWVHYQDPHGPYAPPEDFEGAIEVPPAPGEKPLGIGPGILGSDEIPAYQVLPGLFLPSQYRSRYADEIRYADHWIGILLNALSERSRNEVVLFTSDHGESFGENQLWFVHTHATTPDVAWVPFLLKAPGLEPARRDDPVHHVDVLPTLLELAGLPVPADSRGIALAPLLRAGTDLPERALVCDSGDQLAVYQGSEFTLVDGVGAAWDDVATLAPRGFRFRWAAEGWARLPHTRNTRRIPESILRYATEVTPMAQLPPPNPEMIKRLEALGYAEPGESARH